LFRLSRSSLLSRIVLAISIADVGCALQPSRRFEVLAITFTQTDRYSLGMLFARMELLLDRKVPAATLFSGPCYFAEQLGFRKIIDNTFMIAAQRRQ
jgi:hypothetical protein